jgi:hypothetical protein
MRTHTVVLLSLLTGCMFAPDNEGERLDPPDSYRVWFNELQGCTRVRGDFDRIQWYVVDLEKEGYYGWREGWSIWLDRKQLDRRDVVIHEELHVLIGDGEHRSPHWRDCI